MADLKEWLRQCRLIAVLRGIKPHEAEDVGAALFQAGFRIIEVPLNSPEPFDSIQTLTRTLGDRALIGAGTVMHGDDAKRTAAVDGRLIVSPHGDAGLVRRAKQLGLVTVPGFFTVTEAFAMIEAGADALKLFPAEGASPTVLKAMRAVLPPETMVLPVGGISATNMVPWLEAGAAGFGVGSSVYRPGDTDRVVYDKACELVAAIDQATRRQ